MNLILKQGTEGYIASQKLNMNPNNYCFYQAINTNHLLLHLICFSHFYLFITDEEKTKHHILI